MLNLMLNEKTKLNMNICFHSQNIFFSTNFKNELEKKGFFPLIYQHMLSIEVL